MGHHPRRAPRSSPSTCSTTIVGAAERCLRRLLFAAQAGRNRRNVIGQVGQPAGGRPARSGANPPSTPASAWQPGLPGTWSPTSAAAGASSRSRNAWSRASAKAEIVPQLTPARTATVVVTHQRVGGFLG